MYEENQLIPINLLNQFDNLQIDKFCNLESKVYPLTDEQLQQSVNSAFSRFSYQYLLQFLFAHFTIKFFSRSMKEVVFFKEDPDFKYKIKDADTFVNRFNFKLNFDELDKYLEVLKNSKHVKSVDSVKLVSETARLYYKFYYLILISHIYWSNKDHMATKFSFQYAIKVIATYKAKSLSANLKRIEDEKIQNLLTNILKSLKLENTEENLKRLDDINQESLSKHFRKLVWQNVIGSITLDNDATQQNKNHLLRPFYFYLLRNSKSDDYKIYEENDSVLKLEFRKFTSKIFL